MSADAKERGRWKREQSDRGVAVCARGKKKKEKTKGGEKKNCERGEAQSNTSGSVVSNLRDA